MGKLKINKKIYHKASILFSILAIISLLFTNMNVAVVLLGFSQIFIGLDQFKFGEKIDLEENQKGNKYVGIFSIVVGIYCLIISISRLIS
jgi:hypothetical protein